MDILLFIRIYHAWTITCPLTGAFSFYVILDVLIMNLATQRFNEPNPCCRIPLRYFYWYDTYCDYDSGWDESFQSNWLHGPAPKSWVIRYDGCPVWGNAFYAP